MLCLLKHTELLTSEWIRLDYALILDFVVVVVVAVVVVVIVVFTVIVVVIVIVVIFIVLLLISLTESNCGVESCKDKNLSCKN